MDKTTDNDINIDPKNDEQLLDEELDIEQSDSEDSVDEDEVAKLRSENKKLIEIIKRRKEREQSSDSKPKQTINNTQGLSRDEAILIASGFTTDDLDYLNVVAKGTGLSVNEAKEHPIFEAYLEKINAEKKAKRAKLGASKGSSINKPVVLAGLTPEEHKKIWAEKMGQ